MTPRTSSLKSFSWEELGVLCWSWVAISQEPCCDDQWWLLNSMQEEALMRLGRADYHDVRWGTFCQHILSVSDNKDLMWTRETFQLAKICHSLGKVELKLNGVWAYRDLMLRHIDSRYKRVRAHTTLSQMWWLIRDLALFKNLPENGSGWLGLFWLTWHDVELCCDHMTVTSKRHFLKRHFPGFRQYISTIGPLKKRQKKLFLEMAKMENKGKSCKSQITKVFQQTWLFPRHALGLQFRSDLITALPWCGPWLPRSLWSKLGNNGTWRSHGSHGYGGATNGVMMAGPCSPLKCWNFKLIVKEHWHSFFSLDFGLKESIPKLKAKHLPWFFHHVTFGLESF